MRRSPLSVAISLSIMPNVQLATSRVGPVAPYQSWLNQEIYYRMLGREVWKARALGKTLTIQDNYAPRGFNA